MFRRKPKPAPVDASLLYVGLVDAIVVLASTVGKTREELAELYRIAGEQQGAQGQGDGPRALACRTIAQFFAQPLRGDRSRIRLVIDNSERSKTTS